MMENVILGLIQGITEFLPVSSSGHLALAQRFLGFKEPMLTYDVILHLATMAATLVYFRRDIGAFAKGWFSGFYKRENRVSEGWTVGWAVIAGTFLTVIVGLPLRPLAEKFSSSVPLVGMALITTGIILWMGSKFRRGRNALSVKKALPVGVIQGLAVLPGISRSGSTIVSAMIGGLSPEEAFRFSFLLSLPAVAGAALLEMKDISSSVMPAGWPLGFIIAGLSGYLSLKLLHKAVILGRFRIFSAYCLILGASALLFGR